MIRTILIWLFVAIVLIFFIVWALSGGIGRAISAGKGLLSPSSFFTGNASGTTFTLPWQQYVEPAPIEVDMNSDFDNTGNANINDLENQYAQLKDEAERVKLFGTPSPHAGKVLFSGNDATSPAVNEEFVAIQNMSDTPLALSGWSIQSAYTGVRVPLPNAAAPLITGTVNALQPITLAPEESLVALTGASPVGVSFHVNMCSGYLQQFQKFTPLLYEQCPDPGEAMRVTPENLQTYGEGCIDFVRSIPRCHFPTGEQIPGSVTAACRSFVGSTFSYNGCVSTHRSNPQFFDGWRIYFNSQTELWRNGHDVIRLLDETGRTVDVLSY
ncbi:MAG: hypothetical protein RIQ56_740 [Candidatus Parcubacteria bacterium]|jgi:hypothetical protein